MWTTEASAESRATPEQVWCCYLNVSEWKSWDDGLETSSLEGPFEAGVRGQLKPKGAPRSKFVLTAVEPARRFADRAFLPLANLEFEHQLSPTASGTRITHRVRFRGPLAFLFARVIGRKIAAGLPGAVEKLARLAESGQG